MHGFVAESGWRHPGLGNVTAACLRFGLNVKSLVQAAARDGERSAAFLT
jgi:hypothetical protein